MTWSTLLTVLGPLAGVIVGALLTTGRAARVHQADVRREVYGQLISAAKAVMGYLDQAAGPARPSEAELLRREPLNALEVAAAAVTVSGSEAAVEAAEQIRVTALDAWATVAFGKARVVTEDSLEATDEWVATDVPAPPLELVLSIAAFTLVARADVSRSRAPRAWRKRPPAVS